MNNKLSRRQFLAVIAATISGLYPCLVAARNIYPIELFKNFKVDQKSLSAYTTLYMDKYPDENNYKSLERLIFGSYHFSDTSDMRRYLNLQINSDFRQNITVNLDGWILSRTEVRLWCLFYVILTNPD